MILLAVAWFCLIAVLVLYHASLKRGAVKATIILIAQTVAVIGGCAAVIVFATWYFTGQWPF